MLIIPSEEAVMARPVCCRRVTGKPAASLFKPAGIPVRLLEQVVLTLDEFEAVRLADLNGLYHEQAAECMRVSRPTFGRILDAARRKVAEAMILGKALRIEGGAVYAGREIGKRCEACNREPGSPGETCPRCGVENDSMPACRRQRGGRKTFDDHAAEKQS
jgi:uncharacterized protein